MAKDSFGQEFINALCNPDVMPPEAVTSYTNRHPVKRFNVYRNNVVSGLVDALSSQFEVVAQLVGDDFFKAMARAYIPGNMPITPILHQYGTNFGDFIEAFEPVAHLSFLADVARFEWLYRQSYHSKDELAFSAQDLAQFDEETFGVQVLQPHSAVRNINSKHPIFTIWNMHINTENNQGKLSDIDMSKGQFIVISRPEFEVKFTLLDEAEAVFFNAMIDGHSFAVAAEYVGDYCAQNKDISFDLGKSLGLFLQQGFFKHPDIGN